MASIQRSTLSSIPQGTYVYLFPPQFCATCLHHSSCHRHHYGGSLRRTCFCCRLLCAVVDNVEALLDEWFPGLRDVDILNGDELVQPMSLCPLCPSEWLLQLNIHHTITHHTITLSPHTSYPSVTMTPHCFKLKYLQQEAVTVDEVECPQHHGPVLLEQLVGTLKRK